MLKESRGAIVIGAGVIGLACARALASRGIETIIVENRNGIGQEISSRNSEELLHQAALNGVDDIQPITRAQTLRYEPDLHCATALHSPSTGIIDSSC